MKDKLVRSEVINRYTLLDEFLTDIICNYYFRRKRSNESYKTLWTTKPFKVFVHYIMEETYLLKKLEIVRAIKEVPSDVVSAIKRINMAAKKVIYQGLHIFTPEGIAEWVSLRSTHPTGSQRKKNRD